VVAVLMALAVAAMPKTAPPVRAEQTVPAEPVVAET